MHKISISLLFMVVLLSGCKTVFPEKLDSYGPIISRYDFRSSVYESCSRDDAELMMIVRVDYGGDVYLNDIPIRRRFLHDMLVPWPKTAQRSQLISNQWIFIADAKALTLRFHSMPEFNDIRIEFREGISPPRGATKSRRGPVVFESRVGEFAKWQISDNVTIEVEYKEIVGQGLGGIH